ncbi:hypothetical protein D9Q98_004447 [Chlorella vulgaris]|uniref:Putative auto-transporter adhesin head GIN domain-containing protein n=1 Tax=Chlorella vulgaris TaxID=3077 RepID=A0A9D4TPW8_CHLVU|nr:hypothetical protein D9Q98_004447 [Chlorella vulgaris]
MGARCLSAAFCLLCLLAAASAQELAPLEVAETQLQPFIEVDACLPINVLIQPNASADAGYMVTLEAEADALDAFNFTVADSVLRLESAGNLTTNRPIKITVSMPSNALQAINHQGTGAEVFVSAGFDVPSFVASTSFGAGRLYVDGMMAQNASLLLAGTGDAILLGSFGTVNATSSGSGGVFIAGANDTVALTLRGVTNAFVQPGLPTTAIIGTAQGINTVQYTDGTCTVASNFVFLQVCQAVPFVAIPEPDPVWTCGLELEGTFQCGLQGTAFTSAGGVVSTSGGADSTPVSTTTSSGVSALTPSSFQFAGAAPGGSGFQQQSGSVTPGGTSASSNIAGTGSVSATSIAGPGGATTSTTQNGQGTTFQTTGQQTTGGPTSSSSSSAVASSSSTAFGTAAPASTVVAPPQQSSALSQPQSASGVIRVGADGVSQATATTQTCLALARDLRMPYASAN